MAPRNDNPRRRRTPSSAPLLKPTRVSYRVKRKPASPIPPRDVLNSPSYSPSSPGLGSSKVPGAFPRPGKYIAKPLLPFRRVHQFRPYGAYLRFPGAGFLENRLRRKIEAEVVTPLRARIEGLEAENDALRRHWTIQVELQDRGNGEVVPWDQRSIFEDTMRLLTGAEDQGTVMFEVHRLEDIVERLQMRLERLERQREALRKKAKDWNKKCQDVEGRYANVKNEMAALKAQLDLLTGVDDGEEDEDEGGNEDVGVDEDEEQIGTDLKAQFERDVMAAATATTTHLGMTLRSQGRWKMSNR
ncbi:MAG: hypothetical protein Q9213_007371 [Squamulea squamosa]